MLVPTATGPDRDRHNPPLERLMTRPGSALAASPARTTTPTGLPLRRTDVRLSLSLPTVTRRSSDATGCSSFASLPMSSESGKGPYFLGREEIEDTEVPPST